MGKLLDKYTLPTDGLWDRGVILQNHHNSQLREGEMWITNIKTGEYPKPFHTQLKTVRLGDTAHAINGSPLPQHMYRPIFINKSEKELYHKLAAEYYRRSSQSK